MLQTRKNVKRCPTQWIHGGEAEKMKAHQNFFPWENQGEQRTACKNENCKKLNATKIKRRDIR